MFFVYSNLVVIPCPYVVLFTIININNNNLPPSLAKFSTGDRKEGINKFWPCRDTYCITLYCEVHAGNFDICSNPVYT